MSHTEEDIILLNTTLYPGAEIYWYPCRGWTSKLWEQLSQHGWSSLESPAGFRIFIDDQGHKIHTGHLSRPFALAYLAKLMR